MDKGESRQEFFISDDGYINIRLKVITDDKDERERIVGELMGKVCKGGNFELSNGVVIDQLYFHNQNPLTVLKDLKKQMIENIDNMFDGLISRQ
jgi:hypothetical protein